MPNRILRESICTSDTVDRLSWFEEVLYYRLIVNCDDFGRFDGRTAVVKNRLFPLKDTLTLKTVEAALHGLANAGLVTLYMVEGKRFLCLPTWGKYQTQRAKVSKYPAPDDAVQTSENICTQMQADVPVFENRESNSLFAIRESGGGNTRAKRFTPPTLAEVQLYVAERHSPVDPQEFIDFYASKGWMVGKTPMKDWKAACRNAEKWDRWAGKRKSAQCSGDNVFLAMLEEETHGQS